MANGGDRFGQAVTGLLGDPALATGIGLLSGALDRRPVGQTLAQGLQFGQVAAGQAARNELLRQQMRQQQAQQQSGARLAELFASLGQPTGPLQLVGPDAGQRTTPPRVDPALAQVGAELAQSGNVGGAAQLAAGLLAPGADERKTSLQRNLEAAGIDPRSELGRSLVIRSVIGQDVTGQLAGVQASLAQVELQNKLLNAQEKQRAFAAEERDEARQQSDLRSDLLVQSRDLLEAADIVDNLQGSFAEPGQFAQFREQALGTVGFLGDQLGFDTERQQQLVDQAQRFRQLSTSAGVDQFQTFRGTITDTKFGALLNNDLSPQKTPGANRLAIAARLEAVVDQADRSGIEIPDRQAVRRRIRELRAPLSAEERRARRQLEQAPPAQQRGPIRVIPQQTPAPGGGRVFNFDPDTGEFSEAR